MREISAECIAETVARLCIEANRNLPGDVACSLRRARLDALQASVTAASPKHALDRGFALVRSADGRLARRSADFAPGDELHISLAEGSLRAAVLPPAESACQVPQEGV